MAIRKVVSRSIGTDVIVAEDLAANSITVSELSDNAVTNAKLHQDVHRGGRKNLIINGDMQVAQRATSFADACSTGNGYLTVDRWIFAENNGTSNFNCTMSQYQATEGANTQESTGHLNTIKIDVTAAASSLTNGNYVVLSHKIEGSSLRHLRWGTSAGESITLSFWVYSDKTGDYSLGLRSVHSSSTYTSSNGMRRYITKYTINSANTWEYKTITISPDTLQPIMNDVDDATPSLNIQFGLCAAGTDRLANSATNYVEDAWYYDTENSVAYMLHPDQVNLFDSTSNDFYLTGVQLEVGDTATPFEQRSYAEELTLCMRYYQRHDNRYYFRVRNDSRGSQNPDWVIPITFPHPMRDAPTINTFTDSNFTTSGYTSTGGSDLQLTIYKFGLYATGNSNISGASAIGALWWMELISEL